VLEVVSLSAGYGELQVLWEVSLSVGEGELVAIVGPNGAGKTTLINALSGVVEQRGGDIRLAGRSLSRLPAEARVGLGMVQCPEGRMLFGEMTVAENLRAGAYLCRDRDEVRARLASIFRIFPKLEQRRDQVASTMSGGEQQMVAIGRALMANPKLLLLDEPSLGLAPIVVAEMFRAIGAIREAGTTILIVEQNVQQTLQIADRAFVLENGRIALAGEARALLEHAHMRAAYLGTR
jgi:branched-chain amino acid transport system ATP-binding protein